MSKHICLYAVVSCGFEFLTLGFMEDDWPRFGFVQAVVCCLTALGVWRGSLLLVLAVVLVHNASALT